MNRPMKPLWATILLFSVIGATYGQEEKIAVLNPKGTPPPIPLLPMAPRLASLDGRTIYLVDIKYEGGGSLLKAIMEWFAAGMPKANLVFREKGGAYDQEDPALWAEIEAKADAVIMAVGH